MAILSAKGSLKATMLPLPSLKALPGYPNFYGKRREISRLHMLEIEISVLEISKIKLADIPDAE